jgi:hypothetical protein
VKSARGSWRVAIVVILAFAGCGRTEAGEPSDADVDGPETCQPPQQGVTCLAPPPDGATCVPLGQVYDARQPYQECCAGLSPISPNLEPASWCDANCITYGGTPQCVSTLLDSARVCTPCGNDVCDVDDGENACNCPEDCGGLLDASSQD